MCVESKIEHASKRQRVCRESEFVCVYKFRQSMRRSVCLYVVCVFIESQRMCRRESVCVFSVFIESQSICR